MRRWRFSPKISTTFSTEKKKALLAFVGTELT